MALAIAIGTGRLTTITHVDFSFDVRDTVYTSPPHL
jgi:hypothetical protein